MYRSKTDYSYSSNINIDIDGSAEAFEVNQEIIALYASLDSVIERCNFNKRQLKLLELIFKGNIIQDICNMNIGYKKSATYELFNRMIKRIVDENNKVWRESMIKKGYKRDEGG